MHFNAFHPLANMAGPLAVALLRINSEQSPEAGCVPSTFGMSSKPSPVSRRKWSKKSIRPDPELDGTKMIYAFAILGGVGLGVLNELIEFSALLAFPNTNVSSYPRSVPHAVDPGPSEPLANRSVVIPPPA
jgi:hypothetical protein